MTQMASTLTGTTTLMTGLLGAVAAVSLLVGGIGIMNIMLVSVTERTREIGIRTAIGARRMDIITQFLIEAATVSAFGGLLGIGVGTIGSILAGAALIKTILIPSPLIMMGAFLFSAILGIFFGFYPANKASKLHPIEALRNQ
jgi:putative ABC transport system permease protein